MASINKNLSHFRQNYHRGQLLSKDMQSNPFAQFNQWLDTAIQAELSEPNVMTLATADRLGRPSARIVLLKGVDGKGFLFYTNYESQKARQIAENPYGALVFVWLELERQVRVEGRVEKTSAEDSEVYFHSRPKGSQIGAWASPQSRVIKDRRVLDENVKKYSQTYANSDHLPLPPFWGGYRLVPDMVEFWQGRSNRLHDRFRYLKKEGQWVIERLAP